MPGKDPLSRVDQIVRVIILAATVAALLFASGIIVTAMPVATKLTLLALTVIGYGIVVAISWA